MIVDTIGGVESVNAAFQALGLYMTRLKAQTGASAPSVDGRDFAITSAFETCALLATIARRAIVSPEACDDMLSILRRQRNRDKLSRNLPWDERNMLPNPADNWVASKDGINAFNAVRNDAANMHGPRGEVAIAAFTEGCGGSNPGPNPEGNILLGEIEELVWKTVCV
jgi:beta-lactamase class A